jgi:hypothetical protein
MTIAAKSFEKHFTNIEKEDKAIKKDINNSKKKYKLLKTLIEQNRIAMAQKYLAEYLPDKEKVEYAFYASKLVLECFEEYYPDNNTLKTTVKYIEEYINNPKEKTIDKIKKMIPKIEKIQSDAEDDYDRDDIAMDSPVYAARTVKNTASIVCKYSEKGENLSKYIDDVSTEAELGSESEQIGKKVLKYGLELLKKSES